MSQAVRWREQREVGLFSCGRKSKSSGRVHFSIIVARDKIILDVRESHQTIKCSRWKWKERAILFRFLFYFLKNYLPTIKLPLELYIRKRDKLVLKYTCIQIFFKKKYWHVDNSSFWAKQKLSFFRHYWLNL